MAGYAVDRPEERAWVATRTRPEQGRRYIDLSTRLELESSRAPLWRYPPGASGVPHAERVQEELFVVLEGTLTLVLGNPPAWEKLPAGGVAAVRPGTPIHVRNESETEVTFFVIGAPPAVDAADTLPEPVVP
jgi:uncharacterized cupin superfamily protein